MISTVDPQPVPLFANVGRRGAPREAVLRMYDDYQRLRSVQKVANLHGRSRQSVWDLFRTHGLQMARLKRVPAAEAVFVDGEKFTVTKGYLRSTRHGRCDEPYLHRRVWIAANGPVPAKHEIVLIDGNPRNVSLDNLRLQPIGTASRAKGHNQHTRPRIEELLEKHIGMITRQAQKYAAWSGCDIEDLIQEGRLAIIDADRKFDPSRGFKFLTFAVHDIRHRMARYCQNHATTVRLPADKRGKVAMHVQSLDAEIGEDGFTLADTMGTDECVTEDASRREEWEKIAALLTSLDERAQRILRARFFENRTLDDIGIEFGISHERVRQLQNMALRSLRKRFERRKAA